MRARPRRESPGTQGEPPPALISVYAAGRARSVAAVRAAIAALAARNRRVTLAGIEQASRDLPEGAISAKLGFGHQAALQSA